YITIMNQMCEKLPVSNYPNEASSSTNSQGDQELGTCSNSTRGDASSNGRFPPPTDLINTARMVFAEFLGTFILMFCVCGIVASTELMRGEIGLLEYAATGVYRYLTLLIVLQVPFYILAQMLGSIIATLAGAKVYGIQAELATTHPFHGSMTAFWAELIATLIIVFLAASMSYEARTLGHLPGFVIGIAIALAILITGPVSGGSLNPARSLGPAIASGRFNDIWVYIVAPTIGAVTGGLLAKFLRPSCRPCCSSNVYILDVLAQAQIHAPKAVAEPGYALAHPEI
ncbi:hypothetical protein IFM89_017548, partial [Coptis chinensis]